MAILRLAIPSPLRRHFDYLPPDDLPAEQLAQLQPGVRLRVPFGKREVTGYLIEVVAEQVPEHELKAALELLDPTPLLDAVLWQLCRWSYQYYHHPSGEVIAAAFPTRLRKGGEHQSLGTEAWELTTRGKGLPKGALARSPRQAEALALLQTHNQVSTAQMKQAGISAAVLRALSDKELVGKTQLPPEIQPYSAAEGLSLNDEQTSAVAAISASLGQFHCHLVEGVTGSGKTEVYLQLIARTLAQGKQALILIPEIGLTPQTLARFQQRFTAQIEVLHSGLSDGARYRAWEAARSGMAHIVIGTRSAIFTPMAELGLIVVDEEHDASFKQQDGFRYSARDVAIKRAQLADCPVVLGSATPALESLHNALQGRYGHHRLLHRAGAGTPPVIQLLDIRQLELQAGLSQALRQDIGDTLQRGEQVLLFLNRRGYAPSLQCHDCGWVAQCNSCDARYTVHRSARRLRCHHCGAATALPARCGDCHSERLLTAGLGTEQTDDFLRRIFPQWPIFRVDSDSMAGRDAMSELTQQVQQNHACILLGTQMLAKGHHFPGVSLVAVIDADGMLFSADFRGEERMAQLLTQVAGRAGRDELPGRVILQTHYPDHPTLRAIVHSNYHQQALTLLSARAEAGLPPCGQLLMLRCDSPKAGDGERFLQQLRQAAAPQLPPGCNVIGPLPAPMQRRAGMYRCQLLITASTRAQAQRAAQLLVHWGEQTRAPSKLKWSLDVDPQDTA